MALQYSTITGNSAQVLVDKQNTINTTTGAIDKVFDARNINNIILCNSHATDAVSIDLWIKFYSDDGTGFLVSEADYYILNNVTITNGVTLVLEKSDGISFNNTNAKLYIQLSAADSDVDVIIR